MEPKESSGISHLIIQATEMTSILQDSEVNVGVRNIAYAIAKAEKKWWARLLKNEGKPPIFLKVDWDKWIDEEDENGRSLLLSLVSPLFNFLVLYHSSLFIQPFFNNDLTEKSGMDFDDMDFSVSSCA